MRRARFLFVFGLAVSGFAAQAARGDFAHCSIAGQQLRKLNEATSSATRVLAAQSLLGDMALLRPALEKNRTGLPLKLLKLCSDLKQKAFETIFIRGAADLYGDYDFLLAAGTYFFYERAWEASYRAFSAAAKIHPRLLDPNHDALQAWMMLQITAEKPIAQDLYMRRAREYISAMLAATDVTPAQKKTITAYLGSLEEKASKIYTARAIHERAVKLDPTNLKLKIEWAEFEERAGQFAQATKIYEDAFTAKNIDSDTTRKLYLKLLALYKFAGAEGKYKSKLNEAVATFPKDTNFALLKSAAKVGAPGQTGVR